MFKLTVQQQIAIVLVLPAAIELATVFANLPQDVSRLILFSCAAIQLLAGTVLCLLIKRRLGTVLDNAYRISNNLPARDLGGPNDQLRELDDVVQRVHLRLGSATDKYKACLSNSADVICSFQSNYKFSMVSDAAKRIWEYDPYHLVGRTVTEFVHMDDVRTFEEATDKARTSVEPQSVDVRMIRHDGSLCWINWALLWVEKEQAFFGIAKDITLQQQMEALKRDFINMVSHDLRTPLLSLSAFLEVLRSNQYGALTERGVEMATNNQSSVRRLIRLVNDLLDLEKMEDGKLELELTPLPIGEIVHDAVHSVSAYANTKNIEIGVCGTLDEEIEADPQRMVQVVQNLLSNAIKFSPIDSRIVVSAAKGEGEVRLTVSDNGPGIPADKAQYIFDRFRQLPNSEGTGLGLAICHAIVTQHGGTIGVESNNGNGSIFWLKLPAQAQAQAPAAVAQVNG